ncbi:DNA gyrase subunit A [Ruminococcus sp. Marseille-P6503]|uniref:DNA gyrase subunit A n=1 Tax=Ruminococcus sp. Marseille-P6503 TaxID=2364796 RepID=UPI00242DAC10|nr:DNA gyrase subunit A [Ruminococcus sp. Marseille-P6503]
MFSDNSNVISSDVENIMRESFLQYSMAVIVSRALPDVRDGLKPVHRRILYTMYENGLYPDKPYRKCADTVGSVLGRYHPHGDASVYDALVRMAQSFSLRYPMVDGHGNFGSVDGDPPAAYRYTEAKMSKMSLHMLTDINKDTVDFQSNYDDRLKEPQVLPSRFPQLLCNGSTGIAVGMATNIPPHNLNEVIDGIKLLVRNPDCTLDELMEYIKGPDFPTGGIIMGRAGIRAAYGTGRGKIILRANTTIEEIKGRNCIIVHEIPYMVNKARLVESIAGLVKEKRVEGIHDLRDESDREGMRIVVELKKDAIPQVVLNKLFTYTQLQDTVGVIMLALVNGIPKVLTLKECLEQYLDFQVEVIRRRTEFDLKKARERDHILRGLVIALDNIDEVVEIMKTSKNIPEGKQRLMDRFELSEIQADHIANMTLGRLTGMERQKIIDELKEIEEKIADYEDILANHDRVLNIIIQELESIQQKFGDERRTQIENVSGEVDIEDLIPVEESVVTYTKNGYIKRIPVSAYKAQNRGGRGVTGMKQREDDFIDEMYICSTHDHILFISNKGIMYRLKCYELPEGSKASRGLNIVNILPLEENEKIAAMIKTSDFDESKNIVMVTKNGKIKRTPLSSYKNVRKNGLIAIGLDEGDEIAGVRMTKGENQLIIATHNGMAIRIDENCIRKMSRSAHGVKAIRLREGDYVVSMARVRENASVLTVSDKGLGRRTALDSYRIQNRGGYGMLNYKVSEEKGFVCGIKVVDETDDVIMISSDGIIIRFRAADVRIMGRYATGVRLMRLSDDDRVVTFTRAEHDDSVEIAEVEQPSEEELEAERKAAEMEESAEVIEEEPEPED